MVKKVKKKKINKSLKYCTWYRKLMTPFSWCKGKKQNCKGNTKRAKKLSFHCDSQAEKAIKSNKYYLEKENSAINSDSSDNSNNKDNDKDNTSNKHNYSNMKKRYE